MICLQREKKALVNIRIWLSGGQLRELLWDLSYSATATTMLCNKQLSGLQQQTFIFLCSQVHSLAGVALFYTEITWAWLKAVGWVQVCSTSSLHSGTSSSRGYVLCMTDAKSTKGLARSR